MKTPKISLKALDPVFEKLGKLTKVHKIAICVGTVVVIGVAFYFLMYKGKADEISRLEQDLIKVRKELRIARKKASSYDQVKKEKEEAQAKFNIAKKQLPESEEIPALLKNISQLVKDTDLESTLFKPQKERSQEFYAEIPVAMKVVGDFHKVLLFFDKVSRMDRIVNIKNIQMQNIKMKRTVTDMGLKTRDFRRRHEVRKVKEEFEILETTCTAITYKFIAEDQAAASSSKSKSKKKKKKK